MIKLSMTRANLLKGRDAKLKGLNEWQPVTDGEVIFSACNNNSLWNDVTVNV